jgi:hypothetical protein
MDTAMLTALVQGQLAIIAGIRQSETDARNAISGRGIDLMIQELFPGVDLALLTANRDLPNHLQQGTARYVRALTRGTLNWEWEGKNTPPTTGDPGALLNARGRDLVQDATTDGLVSGKFAFFPFIGQDGQLRVATLTGFLWPIYADGDVSEVLAVLQVTAGMVAGKIRYQVRRYSPGLLEVYSNLEDWRKYATFPAQAFPQPHAPDRLPIAFRIVGRDANRDPEGIAQTALPAFRRYVKYAVLVGYLATRGGFEERVVKSDALFNLAKTDPRHPLAQDLKKVTPNIVRLMDSSGTYERLDPVKLAEYRDQEAVARADVRDALNMPDTGGGDPSGEALAEKRENYSESVQSIASSEAEALTEVHALCAQLRPAEYRAGWRVTVTPRFTRDVQSERMAIREDVKTGVLPRSAGLSGLQALGVSYVTNDHITQALSAEALDTSPVVPGA